MGDTAIAVNPTDTCYAHLIGKHVRRPLPLESTVELPIIGDEAVDKEYGTGVLKVTPAHDQIDYATRQLGIPTVLDRTIQQAIHQVIGAIFDIGFSESSYGFRPNRSAHDAVRKAQEYITGGKKWVVDIDLKSFFDQVNHDRLMTMLGRKVRDKMLLALIAKYLKAPMQKADGSKEARRAGTPQGGPLSPLLANIYLDPLDKELEKRGLAFVR